MDRVIRFYRASGAGTTFHGYLHPVRRENIAMVVSPVLMNAEGNPTNSGSAKELPLTCRAAYAELLRKITGEPNYGDE